MLVNMLFSLFLTEWKSCNHKGFQFASLHPCRKLSGVWNAEEKGMYLLQLMLPQIQFSFVEGAPFHENCKNRWTNKLPVPIHIHWVEKLKVPYKWWILS